ncbi:hypothetical protein, partial [Streptomyces sp. NPDC054838]
MQMLSSTHRNTHILDERGLWITGAGGPARRWPAAAMAGAQAPFEGAAATGQPGGVVFLDRFDESRKAQVQGVG